MKTKRNLIQIWLLGAALSLHPLWSGLAWAGNYTFTSVIDNTGNSAASSTNPPLIVRVWSFFMQK